MKKIPPRVFLWLGHFFFVLGIIGALLPVLPTAPFIILASECYRRGSPAFNAWLLRDKRFGPMLRDWQLYRAIPPPAKFIAVVTSFAGIAFAIEWTPHLWLKVDLAVLWVVVSIYILTRPTRRKDDEIT